MSSARPPFSLLDGEEVILYARPHPFSMLGLMAFWLYIAVLGVVFFLFYPEITAAIKDKVKFDFIANHAYGVIWTVSILLPLLIMAIFRINFGYVIVLLLLLAGRFLIWWKVREALGFSEDAHSHLENVMLLAVGLVGVVGVEIFRRGHRYYLTTHRIVARFGALKITERSTLYSKIDDLMLQKGMLGKIFNFGTVIPITSTGLGMGQDMAIAGAAAGGGKGGAGAGFFAAGAKGKNVPRELSIYVLYRIKNPERARDVALEEMSARERPRAGG